MSENGSTDVTRRNFVTTGLVEDESPLEWDSKEKNLTYRSTRRVSTSVEREMTHLILQFTLQTYSRKNFNQHTLW